jgi:hypothetical protein
VRSAHRLTSWTAGSRGAFCLFFFSTILSQPWDPVELARQERIKINDNNKEPTVSSLRSCVSPWK